MIEENEAKAVNLKARYMEARVQWLNIVLSPSGMSLRSWYEAGKNLEISRASLEQELVFHGVILKILRKIQVTLETGDHSSEHVNRSLDAFVAGLK